MNALARSIVFLNLLNIKRWELCWSSSWLLVALVGLLCWVRLLGIFLLVWRLRLHQLVLSWLMPRVFLIRRLSFFSGSGILFWVEMHRCLENWAYLLRHLTTSVQAHDVLRRFPILEHFFRNQFYVVPELVESCLKWFWVLVWSVPVTALWGMYDHVFTLLV